MFQSWKESFHVFSASFILNSASWSITTRRVESRSDTSEAGTLCRTSLTQVCTLKRNNCPARTHGVWDKCAVCTAPPTSASRLKTWRSSTQVSEVEEDKGRSLISQLITDQSSWSSLWSLRNWIKSLKASRLYWDQYSLQMELKRVPTSHTFTSQPPERSLKTRRFKADVSFEEPFPRVSPLTAGTRGWGRRGQRWEKCASTLKCFSLPVG